MAELAIPLSLQRPRTPGRYISVDASYDCGLAGVAYVGLAGEKAFSLLATSCTHAELIALVVAMIAAEAESIENVTFRTDCEPIALGKCPRRWLEVGEIAAFLRKHPSWRVAHVRRDRNQQADAMARRARRQRL